MDETPAGFSLDQRPFRLLTRGLHRQREFSLADSERRGVDQPHGDQATRRQANTSIERGWQSSVDESSPTALGHEPVTQVAIGARVAGGQAHDRWMTRQSTALATMVAAASAMAALFGKYRDRIGDAQRKTAAAPTAGRNASYRLG